MAKMSTLRTLVTLAANLNWRNPFLHGEIDEEICMQILPGYNNSNTNKPSKLNRNCLDSTNPLDHGLEDLHKL